MLLGVCSSLGHSGGTKVVGSGPVSRQSDSVLEDDARSTDLLYRVAIQTAVHITCPVQFVPLLKYCSCLKQRDVSAASSRISVGNCRSVSDVGHVIEIFTSVFSLCGYTKAPVVMWGLNIGPWRTLRGSAAVLTQFAFSAASRHQRSLWAACEVDWRPIITGVLGVGAECQKHPIHIGNCPPPWSRVRKKDIFFGIVSNCGTCRSFKMDTTNTENESLCVLICQDLWFYNFA